MGLASSNKFLIVLIMSLAIIGIIILSNFFLFSKIQNVIYDLLQDSQLTETEHAAGRMENHILQVKDEMITLSKFPSITQLSAENCKSGQQAHTKPAPKIDALLRVDKEGNIVACSSPRFSDYVGVNIMNKDYFTIPAETSEPFIKGIVQGASQVIVVSVPLFESSEYTPYPNFLGEFKGLLVTFIPIEDLYNLYIHPYVRQSSYFIIYDDADSRILMQSTGLLEYQPINRTFTAGAKYSTISDVEDLGETIITSADVILGTKGLRLIVYAPIKSRFSTMSSLQASHLFSLGFILVVGIASIVYMMHLSRSKDEYENRLRKANITLEKIGIKVGVESNKYADSDISLKPGKIYLIKDEDENHAHELFISTLNEGFAGLGIVRDDPERLKERYNLQKTSFIRMSKGSIPDPTSINVLYSIIVEFMRSSRKSVVLIDRLDYLLSENEFSEVMRTVNSLNDTIAGSDCIIIISVNPALVDELQLKRLEAETIDIYGRHLAGKISLPGEDIELLKFVNEYNISSRMVTFRDVTQKFNITKPTTRARIHRLSARGFLRVEQRGRFKSLKITSSGRRLIKQ